MKVSEGVTLEDKIQHQLLCTEIFCLSHFFNYLYEHTLSWSLDQYKLIPNLIIECFNHPKCCQVCPSAVNIHWYCPSTAVCTGKEVRTAS